MRFNLVQALLFQARDQDEKRTRIVELDDAADPTRSREP